MLNTLKVALEKEGLIAEIYNNAVETFRDWSYASGADTTTSWYNPADDIIEAYSDVMAIAFTGTAFIAKDERGITVAFELIEDGDIEAAAAGMACTIADILPERNIAAEREDAYTEYLLEQVA